MPKKKVYFYRVLTGTYSPRGKRSITYAQGEVFEHHNPDLCNIFRNKFEKVDGPDPSAPFNGPAPDKTEGPLPNTGEDNPPTKTMEDRLREQGEEIGRREAKDGVKEKVKEDDLSDATAHFKGADDAGLKVVMIPLEVGQKPRDQCYNVTDNGAVLNAEPLKGNEVDSFITDYIK